MFKKRWMKKFTNYWDGVIILKLIISESDTMLKEKIGGFHTFNIQPKFHQRESAWKDALFNTQSLSLVITNEILKLKKKIY